MKIKSVVKFTLMFGLMSLVICFCLMSLLLVNSTAIKSSAKQSNVAPFSFSNQHHRLALIVPFRDRFTELLQFVPHVSKFLHNQNLSFTINVINQNDSLRFNRASLINAGFTLVKENCDYIAMHDVDLLPLNPNLNYGYPESGPFHVTSPELHPKYHYETFVGGILLMTTEHFQMVNGLSNRYWGWGLEDDEFYLRLKEAKLQISRPTNIETGIGNTFLHIHNPTIRKRDYAKLFNQKEATRKRDRQTGLDNVEFELTSLSQITIDNFPVNIYSVKLICDHKSTPWCDFSLVNKNKTKSPRPK
ncbi:beta-1,4-galactosyltransferase 7-like [Panonychus citri]|uniref:beta-1,4-galactosyltransferase 7-like n=1 Tax=Panonychus citri TaxID=50023 RepID=UPI0023081C84|nr:beta-1,4-galactosyltransferase 7-like [Panonychus citri]